MTRRRVVLAAFFVSILIASSSIGYQSGADTDSIAIPTTLRGSIHPTGFRITSSAPEEVRLTVSVPTLHVQPLGGREYRLTLEGGEPLAVDGAPDLPVFRRLVAVADGGEVSVAVRVNTTTVLDGVSIRSYRIPPSSDSRSLQPSFSPPTDAFRPRTKFPKTNASVEYVGHLRGQRIVSILVCPVQCDAVSGKVTVATDMELVVTVDRSEGRVLNDIGPMDAALTGAVLNWTPRGSSGRLPAGFTSSRTIASAGGQVCWCTGSTWEAVAASAASCGADYLIVVTDSLASSSLIDTLALRRASYNGFNVAIAKVSQIDASPDTLGTPVAIRAMIDSVYASQSAAHMSDGRLGYVLLVGDAFDSDRNVLLPSYYGYGAGQSQRAASDAYYSFLDDDPATDLLPDVLIGRLPVDDDSEDWELTNVVTKIVAYEPLPASAWVDSVLMVSGVSDLNFTFQGDGLSGFQSFFDSTLANYSPPGKSVTQLHRLTLPTSESNHATFGEQVANRVEAGKWLTAFFDHGALYYWHGAFYPRNYEFLDNEDEPTIVLSLGSQTSQFDNTQETAQAWYSACCTFPPPSSLSCESPGHEYMDPCDAMAERLLVQPNGAVAVIGYSRTTESGDAQADFVNLFRSLSQQNPGTLGEFLVGARLFRLSRLVTARNLMLLGDPALNMRTRAPAAADTFDVAVGTLDIRSPWSTYVRATGSPIEATVHNTWKTDVYNLEVELWRGEPGGEESTLLESEVIDTLRAYGPETLTFSVSGLEGNVRLYVVLDPEDDIAERAEDNNVALRDFVALRYEGDFPTRLPFNPRRSVTIEDLTDAPGKEFLVTGLSVSDNLLQCYESSDTVAAWTYSTGSVVPFIKSQPVAGHVYKSASKYVAVEWGNPSSVRILSGQTGAVVKTRAVGDTRISSEGWEARCLLTDLGSDDAAMELLVLKHVDAGIIDTLHVRAFAPTGAALFTRKVDVANNAGPATMAVGDLDKNGSKEIVILQRGASGDLPASGNELTVLSYGASGLTRMWQADAASAGAVEHPALVLVDTDGDGELSILCNGASFGQVLRLYDADSTLVWTRSDFTVGGSEHPAIYFSAGDVNGDGNAEVVVADHERIRVLASGDGSVLETRTMVGDPIAPPLLVDLDANGTLEIIALFEKQDPHEHFEPQYWFTYISVLDESLDLFQSEWTLRSTTSNSNACLPAVDDIDDDGKYEMVYVSPDRYLHVFELGSSAGAGAWSQRFANALNTGLTEQPILGDGYTNPVSLYQRTRMLGHVTLDSIGAPSLYVGHGTEVLIDTSMVDGYALRAYGSVRIKGSAAAPVSIRTVPASSGESTWHGLYIDNRFATAGDPDTLLNVRLSDAWIGVETRSPTYVGESVLSMTHGTGLHATDWLRVENSDIFDSYGRGVYVGPGGDATIIASRIEYHETTGLACEECELSVSNGTSVSYNGLHGVHMIEPVNSNLSSSVFQHNDGDGVRCEDGNPTISACLLRKNDIGMSCWYDANPTMTYSRADSNGVGVSGSDNSYPFLGSTDEPGHNCIVATTAHHVVNLNGGTAPIYTQINYYGSVCCKSTKFSGPVVCQPCDSGPECTEPSGMIMIVAESSVDQDDIPKQFDLGPGYPNPFNPIVTIPYDVASPGGRVEIVVYNVRGQRVATLATGHKTAGRHVAVWRGGDDRGAPTATGVYFVRMTAPGFVKARKILLLK